MKRHSLLLPLILTAAGCAMHGAVTPDMSIDELARNHQYNSALVALKQRDRNSPDYRERRHDLQAAARAWEKQLLEELDQLVARKQFAAAQLQLERAVPELPETPALRRYVARFYERRDVFIAEQMVALTRVRGEHLLKEQPYYERLRGVEGDYRVRDAVDRYREDADFFAARLRESGLRAFDTRDWGEAVALLDLSNRLRPNEFTTTHLAAARTQLQAMQDQAQNEQRQREHTLRNKLRERFDNAMHENDLKSAENVVRDAAQLLDPTFTRQLQQQLDEAQQTAATVDIEAGNRLYGEGKVEQALRRWQQAQRYDQSAELEMKIDRAQRLLEHYRELREQSR